MKTNVSLACSLYQSAAACSCGVHHYFFFYFCLNNFCTVLYTRVCSCTRVRIFFVSPCMVIPVRGYMCSYLCTYVSVCLCVCVCVPSVCQCLCLYERAHVHSFNIHVLSKSAHEIYSFFLSSSTCANNLLKVICVCVCVCLSLFLSLLLTVVCVCVFFSFFFLSLTFSLSYEWVYMSDCVCVRVCRLASWLNTVCGPAPDAT